MAKKGKVKPDQIFRVLAHGHSFSKHVLGQRTEPIEFIGRNEFRHSGHGRDLKIEKPEDLEKYFSDNLNKGKWEGFSHPASQKYYFFNRADNVFLIINTAQSVTIDENGRKVKKINDLGTVYRPPLEQTKDLEKTTADVIWGKLQNTASDKGGEIKKFTSSEKGIQGITRIKNEIGDTQNLFDIALDAVGKSGARRVLDNRINLINDGLDKATLGLEEKEQAARDAREKIEEEEKAKQEAKERTDTGKKKNGVPGESSKLSPSSPKGPSPNSTVIPDVGSSQSIPESPSSGSNASKSSNLIDEAVEKGSDAVKLLKLKNLEKGAKLGLVTTVVVTGAVHELIDKAHATQRDSADLFKQAGVLTPKAHKEYIALNKSVEKMMKAENFLSQGPAFIVTTPMVEAKAASNFGKFSKAYNLTPKVHKALGMSMFDGKSTIGQFADAVFEAIPNKKEGAPKSLHALIDSKNRVNNTNKQYDNLTDGLTAYPRDRDSWVRKSELPGLYKKIDIVKIAYSKQFQKTFADPEAAKYLVNKMPTKVLADMTIASARGAERQPNVSALIRNLAESQEKQTSLEVKKANIDKQLASHKDGKSAMSRFTDAVFEALPSNKESAPKSLHALIDSKNTVIKAGQNLTKMVSNLVPSDPIVGSYLHDIKNAKEGIVEVQLDKANAKLAYSKQFQKAVSDPTATKYLASRMPKNRMSEMSANTFMKNIAEVQVKQSSLEVKKISIEKQLEDSKELTRTLEKKLSTQPEILKNHIIKQMGNKKFEKTLETDTQKNPKSNEEKNGKNDKIGKLESTEHVKLYRSLSSAEKKQYLPAQAWKQLGFLPLDGERGEKFSMRNARGEQKQLQLYSANSVHAVDPSDKRDPAQVSPQYYQHIAQIRSQNRNQSQEMDV